MNFPKTPLRRGATPWLFGRRKERVHMSQLTIYNFCRKMNKFEPITYINPL
jgi:hypothetical protein